MLTLTILHNIFLSRQERLSLADGNQVEAVGVSIPVWYHKGKTSEPAKEIFCEYILTNTAEDYPVTALARGYKINLPQTIPGQKTSKLNKKQLEEMSMAEQNMWLQKTTLMVTAKDLLDFQQGGLQSAAFKRYDKVTTENQRMNVIHTIEINDIERLKASLPPIN